MKELSSRVFDRPLNHSCKAPKVERLLGPWCAADWRQAVFLAASFIAIGFIDARFAFGERPVANAVAGPGELPAAIKVQEKHCFRWDWSFLDLAISPDGHLVAACTFDGKVFIWEMASGKGK